MAACMYFLLNKRKRLLQELLETESVPRHLLFKGNWTDIPDKDFIGRFRLDKRSFIFVCSVISDSLKRSAGYSVELQVLTTLRFLSSGSFQSVIADDILCGCSQSTVSRNITSVTNALLEVMPQFIQFPNSNEELMRKKSSFFAHSRLPNIIGAIDCTHIPIMKPKNEDAYLYINRKGICSVNVQIVCDAEMRILDIVARWPGSNHDAFIWRMCGLRRMFAEGHLEGRNFLIGDSGYPLEPWLLTPYSRPQNALQNNFNYIMHSSRSVIERCFGLLKSRFRCLDRSGGMLCYTAEKVFKIICASAVLHNVCIDRSVVEPDITISGEEENEEEQDVHQSSAIPSQLFARARNIRNEIARNLYLST